MLCLAWQDNNIILVLSNIYIVDKAENFRETTRRRLIKTSINKQIVRKVFRNDHTKNL
jgi:uncharacterized protein YdeI (YjbR/CyaY-like superfamily)